MFWYILLVWISAEVVCKLIFPEYFMTTNYVLAIKRLFKQGNYKRLALTLFMSQLYQWNRFLINLEELLIPGLTKIEHDLFNTPNRVIFVFGHPRSGTTNIHKALSSLDGVATGHYYDILMSSLTMKYLCYPIVSLLDAFFFKTLYNSDACSNHKIGPWEELEESLLCMNMH